MAGASTFAFNVDDLVQFKDGRNARTGFVTAQVEPSENHPVPGYTIFFRMNETGQNRLAWWAANDVQAADVSAPKFKIGDAVAVDVEGGPAGKVVEVAPINKDELENQYGVSFKGRAGKTDLAWWPESMLVAAK